MINQESLTLGQTRSVIRELFEYGNQRAKVVGRENIFDFSIGNPSVPPPPQVYNTSDTRGQSRSYGMNYQKTGKDMPYLFVKSSVALNLS